jgi:MSHA biogenesis protein MshM
MALYLEHFGLHEPPFRITPGTRFFYDGARRAEVLLALQYAISNGAGLIKVVGEVGSGKTMLCRVLMERMATTWQIIYLPVPSISRDELLLAIAEDLGVTADHAPSTTRLLRNIQAKLLELHAQGKQAVVLIDEAHAMPSATLEELRLISNLETDDAKLLQIVLFGQPELDEHLSHSHMRQLRDRITESFVLSPLPERDVQSYLDFRLRQAGYKGTPLFDAELSRQVAQHSQGLTRRINILADKVLLAAYSQATHHVQPEHLQLALGDVAMNAVATNATVNPHATELMHTPTTASTSKPVEALSVEMSRSGGSTRGTAWGAAQWFKAAAVCAVCVGVGTWIGSKLGRVDDSRDNSPASANAAPVAPTHTASTHVAASQSATPSPASSSPAIKPEPSTPAQPTPVQPTTAPSTPAQPTAQPPATPAVALIEPAVASQAITTPLIDKPYVLQLMTNPDVSGKPNAAFQNYYEQVRTQLDPQLGQQPAQQRVQKMRQSSVTLTKTGSFQREVIVVLGFDSMREAAAAITALPPLARRYQPYARAKSELVAAQ